MFIKLLSIGLILRERPREEFAMSKISSLIRRAPKRFSAVVAMVAAAIIVPAAVLAWGPDRPTYTVDSPADHITFNSITNNPNVGDERDFVVVKDAANTNNGGWQNNVTVEEGKEYLVRVYAHNNAASSLNLTATNTRVSASVPTTTAKSVPVSGFISADNASPQSVWDDINFTSDKDFNLEYIAGSAVIYNNGYAQNGQPLSDNIVTSTGALIGYNGADGKVPGCFQYANYIYFKVRPHFAPTSKFTMSKQVSKHDENQWVENYDAQPGETVDFLVKYKNTGEAQQNDVTFRDTLPTGLSYVNGSTMLINSKNPSGSVTSDNIANGTGINVGSYTSGANALVRFSAKVATNDQLPKCGENVLTNKAKVTTGGGSIEDTATVTVTRECEPGKITVCELSSNNIITINEDQFDSKKHSKDLDDCELPTTGPTENIVAILGAGSLIAAIAYYIASRRALNLQ